MGDPAKTETNERHADMLNRIRVGDQTREDMDLLRKRLRPKNHQDLKNALYIGCKKIACQVLSCLEESQKTSKNVPFNEKS